MVLTAEPLVLVLPDVARVVTCIRCSTVVDHCIQGVSEIKRKVNHKLGKADINSDGKYFRND